MSLTAARWRLRLQTLAQHEQAGMAMLDQARQAVFTDDWSAVDSALLEKSALIDPCVLTHK